jgi:hypothetical protein
MQGYMWWQAGQTAGYILPSMPGLALHQALNLSKRSLMHMCMLRDNIVFQSVHPGLTSSCWQVTP